MSLIHEETATVDNGIHHSYGWAQVEGATPLSHGATILPDVAEAILWLDDNGNEQFVVDTSAFTSFGITAWYFGSSLSPAVFSFTVDDGQANAFLVEDDAGDNYLRIRSSLAIELSNANDNAYVEQLGSGDFRLSSQIRMTERTGDPTNVANAGFIYTKDASGITELFYEDSAGNVRQLTPSAGGGTLDAAYDFGGAGNGRNVIVDAGAIELAHSAADTWYALHVQYGDSAYTGTAHGILVDWTDATSLSNASDVYGINLIGETNAGAGDSVGVRVDSGWDVAAELGGNIEIPTDGTTEIRKTGSASSTNILALLGNQSAAGTGSDLDIRSTTTRTAGSLLRIRNNTTTRVAFGYAGQIDIDGSSISTAGAYALTCTPAAWTSQTAGAEVIAVDFDLSHTVTHGTGAITTQRDFLVQATTHAFNAGSTITDAATLAISGAPIAGTNATITNAYAIWAQSGNVRFDGNVLINHDAVAGSTDNPFIRMRDGDGAELVDTFIRTNRTAAGGDGSISVYSALSSITDGRSDRSTRLIVGGGTDSANYFSATSISAEGALELRGHESGDAVDAVWTSTIRMIGSSHDLQFDAPVESGSGGAGTRGAFWFSIADDLAYAFRVRESSASYIEVVTTNSAESVLIGNDSCGQIQCLNEATGENSIRMTSDITDATEGVWRKTRRTSTTAGGANVDAITFPTSTDQAGNILIRGTAWQTSSGGNSHSWQRLYNWENDGGSLTLTEFTTGGGDGGDATTANLTAVISGTTIVVRATASATIALQWTIEAEWMLTDD